LTINNVVLTWFDTKDCEARTREALKKKVGRKLLDVFKDLDKFLMSIPKVKYFHPDGNPVKSWKIFYGKTTDAARAAARDAGNQRIR
jgi:hypothetical protein